MEFEAERELLIKICRLSYEQDLVAANDGNFSLRVSDGRVLITPSRRNKYFIQPQDLLLAGLDGKIDGPGKVSSEFPLHRLIYETAPSANAVFHSHPPYATAFSTVGRSVPDDYFIETALFLKEIPIVPYARPGTQDLAEAVRPHLPESRNLLLRNHGVLVWGNDAEEAFNRLHALENVCRMALYVILYTQSYGAPYTISAEELMCLQKKRTGGV